MSAAEAKDFGLVRVCGCLPITLFRGCLLKVSAAAKNFGLVRSVGSYYLRLSSALNIEGLTFHCLFIASAAEAKEFGLVRCSVW